MNKHVSKKTTIISQCLYCGNYRTQEVVLCDIKTPDNAELVYEPCEECKKHWQEGLVLIGVSREPTIEGQPPIAAHFYPTGAYAVFKEKYKTMLPGLLEVPETTIEKAFKKGRALIEYSVLYDLVEDHLLPMDLFKLYVNKDLCKLRAHKKEMK